MTPDPQPCPPEARYGAHERAHPTVHDFAARVDAILASAPPEAIPGEVAAAMGPLLTTGDLLCEELRRPGAETYRKHVLYADPAHRFTLLALVWEPGQGTDIHGHTAWGAVGVYEGEPSVTCYACEALEGGRHAATETKSIRCTPGDTATVRPGLEDTHRICNETETTAITLHAYGLDLVTEPDAINIHLVL